MRFHERSFKLRGMSKNEDSSREENPIRLRKMRKRKKIRHISLNKKKKGIFSQVKKNENALEKIKEYKREIQIHPRKMEFYQIERNFFFLVKANKIPKRKRKEKKKLARLKTRKDGIGKIRAKTKQQKIKKFFHKK